MKDVMSLHKKDLVSFRDVEFITQNIFLEGYKSLNVEVISITYNVVKEINPRNYEVVQIISKEKVAEEHKTLKFPLVEVTPKQLSIYRASQIPSFVLKINEHLYYSKIENNFSFALCTILGTHKCSFAENVCSRLSAALDENGGCEKVRKFSKCIENFPWITSGYETFNTYHDIFIVISCLHYKSYTPSKKLTPGALNRLKLNLAQFLWDDVSSIEEIDKHIEENGLNFDSFISK